MIEPLLLTLVKAMLGVTTILVAWLAVQWSWIRVTGAANGQDALQGRLGCHGCRCDSQCDNIHE
ncbi:hypothetical protein LF1_17140 [Rubripirellula obstinata]|uniref:Uncharacterized protein n=1 Tax=Rubripirellula obstinata TaxID=406547 RepID=A0A5B1CGX8_9BACT|nr:hypothetical protein [Rubripirellula obstinata]KAA1259185.1 hypothetical protein LF1_17140 [Rubripirellula obstinata]